MTHEEYIVWSFIDNQPKQMLVEKLSDSDRGLSIILRHAASPEDSHYTNTKLEILFDPYVAYRNMDEGYRAKTIEYFPEGFKETFYIIDNSSWLGWLHNESNRIYSDYEIKHYSIITIADWIDVLSEFPPEVLWIN